MSDQGTSGVCQETAGFLFKHACKQLAIRNCAACGKSVCSDHHRVVEGQLICIACAKSNMEKNPSYRSNRRYTDRAGYDPYDPYYYGGYHYSGWGHYGSGYWGHSHYDRHRGHSHDPNDFTEADGESVAQEGGEAFENDLSES